MDPNEIAEILAAYELGRFQIAEPLDCDLRRPWKVVTERGEFVAKECFLNRSPEELSFEHGLAAWLSARGFPAARALPTRRGDTWVERGSRIFAVYVLMPGEPFSVRDAEQAESAGACLGRFHGLASAYESARARRPPPGYRHADGDAATIRERWPDRREVRWLLDTFRRFNGAVLGQPLPEALLVSDFRPGNVVFLGKEVSGLFDLECCCWGPRLVDLANSVLWFSFVEMGRDRVAQHGDEFDLACARAFLRGHESAQPLRDEERQLLPTALRRQIRRWALFDSVEIHQPGDWRDWEWEHSRRQIDLVDSACDGLLAG
ncbi:MAG: phosphotransferase enzyme family protein [Planctomycetota bacterium]|jgi:homoserine kinase type II